MRVFATKIIRGKTPLHTSFWHTGSPVTMQPSIRINACRPFSDVELMCSVWQRYDALATDGGTGDASSARVFTFLIFALKRLATPPYSASLRRCTMWVYIRATRDRIFIATTAWTASRRYDNDSCECDGVGRRWDDWHKGWLRTICSDENIMVRLSDQRSADRLPTLSRHYHLSVSIDQLDKWMHRTSRM